MTNRNMLLNMNDEGIKEMIRNCMQPFLLRPVCKDYLWGGTRLAKEYGKEYGVSPLAETWECSVHPDGVSVADSGVCKGMPLDLLIEKCPEILGTHPIKVNGKKQFPILVKFIDAGRDASVQVHPDDAYARLHENGENGKAEMWYVLDAEEDAKLTYGFYRDMDRETVQSALADGSIGKYLRKVNVKKDDVFYIEPGCIHAIGAGTLIAEIQQNSNVTYRLYDYERHDKNGKKRELHVDKALEVANLKASGAPRQPMRTLKYQPGCATELLCRCKYFQAERVLVNAYETSKTVQIDVNEESFIVLMCLEGNGVLKGLDELAFKKGDCIFIPASAGRLQLEGKHQLLKIRC